MAKDELEIKVDSILKELASLRQQGFGGLASSGWGAHGDYSAHGDVGSRSYSFGYRLESKLGAQLATEHLRELVKEATSERLVETVRSLSEK
jgi:hypothetical protein